MSPGAIAELLLQVAASLAVGWAMGGWILRRLLARASSETQGEFGLPEQALFSILGLFAFAVVAMVLNLITGGAVFGMPGIVPIAGGVVILLRQRGEGWPEKVPWGPVLAFLAVLLLLYMTPVVTGGSGARLGDPQWHLGWTEQLLHGQAIPTGPAPRFSRNAYPWGYHALLATMVRLIPGSTALRALDATHVLFLMGLPLAAACLARRLRRDAGWFAAAAVSLVGGWGWLSAHGPAFAAVPERAHHGADLVVASPNAVYELFPPGLPRELGLLSLAAAACLALIAGTLDPSTEPARPWREQSSLRFALAAGIAAGITGLISVPLFLTSVVWLAGAGVMARRGSKLRLLVLSLGLAALVFALWAGPVVADYLRLGGFVNISPHLGTEWSLAEGFSSWGLLAPASAAGLVLLLLHRTSRSRMVLAFAVASALLMALALARAAFDWQLAGNRTLVYQGRVWPPAHLLAGAFAGVALVVAYRWLRDRSRFLAVGLFVVLAMVGVASPALASIRLARLLPTSNDGYIYGSPNFAPAGFVRQAAAHLGPRDTVLVNGSSILALSIFSFSGARLARYDDPRLSHNDLRIRYADLARRWDRQAARGGFRPDFTVARADETGPAPVVARGVYGGVGYVLVQDR